MSYDKHMQKDHHEVTTKNLNKTLEYGSKYQNQKDNKRESNNVSKTPLKDITSKREDRIREFNIRSQRKTDNKMLAGQNSKVYLSQDMTPKKNLGAAYDIMSLANQLDQRNKMKHMNRNLVLGNEASDHNNSSSFANYHQRSVERINRNTVNNHYLPPKMPTHPRGKSTIEVVRKSVDKDFNKNSFFGGKSNDFNLNNIKINPITGQLSPLQHKTKA